MPKRTSAATIAVAAVLLLTLAGCAGTPESPASEPTAPAAATSAPPAETPTPTDAPTGPVEVTAAPSPESTWTLRDQVIADIHASLVGQGYNVTTEQVVQAADYTCEQLAAGVDKSEIVPFTGDFPADRVEGIINSFERVYCAP
ncbi:hypothetical protein K8F61_05130 [Microbacterium resistens]|uniref:DUF732 domain-containing protein n=1 Tax=Microbacterium resistens TaxID=156977 RepID=A0ABY3RU26_9MICO|nr:hypothetical protein [Microbacterium resistens]UGS27573.1 hypothetical protein K8F61_05130 [Microbacterium resistens]